MTRKDSLTKLNQKIRKILEKDFKKIGETIKGF